MNFRNIDDINDVIRKILGRYRSKCVYNELLCFQMGWLEKRVWKVIEFRSTT